LLGEGRAVIVEPEIASREALLKYHSRGFVGENWVYDIDLRLELMLYVQMHC
jgi:hypothetical protein